MPRMYTLAYRRQNPSMFPEVCPTCTPQRRFKLPFDIAQHNVSKHCIGSNPRGPRETYASSVIVSAPFSSYSSLIKLPVSVPTCKLYSITRLDLDKFVHDEIEPDTAYNDSCKAVVNRLCQFMKNNFPDDLRPAEIIKSGSLGKGTAVKGKSDADLVVFLADPKYNSIAKIKHNIKVILAKMTQYLKYGDCDFQGTTPHAVKVSVSCHVGHTHDVDILPSFDILKQATDSMSLIYDEMAKNVYDREFYSAALAPLQLDFVSSQNSTKLKTLIRLVKYWRKTAFEESTGFKRLPSSYPLELITIGEWWDVDRPTNFDLRKGFYSVLRALAEYNTLAHFWTINYGKTDVSRSLLTRPYVMDPANPFNDVMTSCNCWIDVASKARECLNKPLFSDLCGKVSWV